MALCAAAVVCTVFLIPSNEADIMTDAAYTAQLSGAATKKAGDFKNIKTNEDRVEFLASYGWQVEPEEIEIVEVTIPSEFDSVYKTYNELQKGEGLDLEKYRGKSVKRYTYRVKNYESETEVFANVIVYKNRVIGGDVCSSDVNGFMHGFTKSNSIVG